MKCERARARPCMTVSEAVMLRVQPREILTACMYASDSRPGAAHQRPTGNHKTGKVLPHVQIAIIAMATLQKDLKLRLVDKLFLCP